MSQASNILNKDAYLSWQVGSAAGDEPARPKKRARVALACQRCKLRKQKCDGARPSCSKCRDFGSTCEYIIPSKPIVFGKSHYLKALEERVAELESYLTRKGIQDVGSDHWRTLSRQPVASDDESYPLADVEFRRQSTALEEQQLFESNSEEPEDTDKSPYRINTMIGILRDLSLDANGGYMGGTAHITIGRLVGSIVKGKNTVRQSSATSSVKDHLYPSVGEDDSEQTETAFTRFPSHMADRCVDGYLKHVSTRFPVIHSPKIKDLHTRRNILDDVYEICMLHLIYGIGGRFLETTGEMGGFFPERHHAAALKLLDEILQFHDTRSVQVLILLAIYCLRSPQGPGAWTYVGLAMRIAIDLGLHRRTSAMNAQSLENELRKRLFWSCYNLDRQVSIPLGRPFAISDRDIDIPLPLDVDEETDDVEILETASKFNRTAASSKSTTLSLFVRVAKLRMIESHIQQKIYRVDSTVEATDAEIDGFSAQLAEWKDMIPLDSQNKSGSDSHSIDSYEHYMTFYYKCLRLLLYPQVSRAQVNPRYLKKCAEACGGVCRTYKQLHQQEPIGYSLMALQSVFMAGLTLIYCTWMNPALIFNSTTSNDISACSIVLFVITERWPGAKKYRNTFEVVKQNVIDRIAEGKHLGPRQAIMQLKTGLQSTLQSMQGDEDQQDECSTILTDMAGEKIAVEQRTLMPSSTPQAASEFDSWQPRPLYGLFTPEPQYMLSYNNMGFDEHTGHATGVAEAPYQRSNLYSDEFHTSGSSIFPEWR